jgi:hypothetical protein
MGRVLLIIISYSYSPPTTAKREIIGRNNNSCITRGVVLGSTASNFSVFVEGEGRNNKK